MKICQQQDPLRQSRTNIRRHPALYKYKYTRLTQQMSIQGKERSVKNVSCFVDQFNISCLSFSPYCVNHIVIKYKSICRITFVASTSHLIHIIQKKFGQQ